MQSQRKIKSNLSKNQWYETLPESRMSFLGVTLTQPLALRPISKEGIFQKGEVI